MKKKIYQQPAVEVFHVNLSSPIQVSRGWAKDGNPPTQVFQEKDDYGDEYYEDGGANQGDGFFLDLD